MARATRSSLLHHRFPAFYACYLLKSVRTPRATATYIGSTPSPPRRIRQHNGKISQGAWKTKHNRPWVMQMIVHGFPSKLAALQFEWAWQHPNKSRHLRDDDGNAVFNHSGKLKYMNANVRVARNMVSSHPYNTWPLCVRIFTEDAEKAWKNAAKAPGMPLLPTGLKVFTELEGVDGESGKAGSGRTAPIDVTDDHFTSEHLRKASEVFSAGNALRCSICHAPVQHDADPLSIALCPTSSCTAVSHLSCLSRHFLKAQPAASNADIIPRGGTCDACQSYILWGDVIRGCYRRRDGGASPDAEPEDADERVEDGGQLFGAGEFEDDETDGPSRKRRTKPPAQPRTKKRARTRAATGAWRTASYSMLAGHVSSDERENFDLDAISNSSDDQDSADDGRPQRHPVSRTKAFSRHTSSKIPSLGDVRSPVYTGHAAEHHTRLTSDGGNSTGSDHLTSNKAAIVDEEDGGRPRVPTADTTGGVRFVFTSADLYMFSSRDLPGGRDRSRHEEPPRMMFQTSRKPLSVDAEITRARDADPSGLSHDSVTREGLGLWQTVVRDALISTDTALDIPTVGVPESAPIKPKLRPLPGVPPLSLPHGPMSDRGRRMVASEIEVVEISD